MMIDAKVNILMIYDYKEDVRLIKELINDLKNNSKFLI